EGSRVPDDHAPLLVRRNEVPAVATVRETADPLVVSLERAEFLASAQVPDVYGIQSTGSKIPAVGTERNAPNGAGMFQRGEAAVALALEVVPFPAAQVLRAAVEQLLGPADFPDRQFLLRLPDAAEVKVEFKLLLGWGQSSPRDYAAFLEVFPAKGVQLAPMG